MDSNPDGPRVVIVAYRPKPGKEAELLAVARDHMPVLRAQGLVTERAAITCQAADGTIVEVFEWAAGGIERAHTDPEVGKLWERYAPVCDFVPLDSVAEAAAVFAGFTPLDF